MIVKDADQIKPAPAIYLQIRCVCLPLLINMCSLDLEGTRTLNLRIDSPDVADDNPCNGNNLANNKKTPCRPAYRDSSDTVSLNGTALPNELSELILCWSDLPEHIKQAIHTLARGSK